jgi:crotonobetainyl-CoA:carnitine CoA-transferase CaiB-like acyl-CoA transferase
MSGRGRHLDVSQIEATLPFLADAFLDWSLNERRRERTTNDHPSRAPHGAFPAQGDDQWIAISVGTDDEWWALAELAGRADWAIDERFRTPALRQRNRHELREVVAEWTRLVDKDEAAAELRLRGVPAAPVRSPAEQIEDRELRSRGFLQWVDHPVARRHPYPSFPARIDGEHPPIERVGPLLGEDNRFVLKEILGLDDAEIARLEQAKVIGTEPLAGD